ncbi:MAG: hypothetical protein ACI89X_003156 [Planctomycetota bacterium]|jgi:hypothetical protein
MNRLLIALLLTLTSCSVTQPGEGRGLGVVLRSDAVLYIGSAHFCTRPATFDMDKVSAEMSEWREIQRTGVRPGSARYSMWKNKMHSHLVAACKKAAVSRGYDLIVRSGDIKNDGGFVIGDLTADVIGAL